MSKIFKMLLVALLVVSCSKKEENNRLNNLTIMDGDTQKAVYNVELAQTKEEMNIGLMNKDTLDENSGMLFDLRQYDVPTAMWMKDTKLALDMLFIDEDGMIFWIYENAEPMSTKLIVSPYPANAVLEVNAGSVKKNGIKIGDVVKHQWFEKKSTEEKTSSSKEAVAEVETPVEEVATDSEETLNEETSTPPAEE